MLAATVTGEGSHGVRRLLALLLALAVPLLVAPSQATAAGGGLAGTVEGPDAEPVAGATVTILAADCVDGTCDLAAEATTAADGSWSADGLEPGPYALHVRDASGTLAAQWWDGRTQPADTVTVVDGDVQGGLHVTLVAASAITGQVRDHDDAPLAGARVLVRPTAFWTVEDVTDADGRYGLGGLSAGTYELILQSGAPGLTGTTAILALDAGEVVEADVAATLQRVDVTRVRGDTRVTTAVEASRAGFASAGSVVLASADTFPDALAAAPLAARLDAPLLLTGGRLHGAVADEVQRLGASEVVIVGAIGAVPLVVQEELALLGVEVERVPGETRFDTAALLARRVGAPDGQAIVASGEDFPDALSAAPLAAAGQLPILLTPRAGLVPDTSDALDALDVDRTLIVGGGQAVGGAVADALPSPRRLAGRERYATSVEVVREVLRRGGSVATLGIATGADFPDALAAGPVLGRMDGAVLLVDGRDPDGAQASRDFLAEQAAAISELWVFGGTTAVSGTVLERLRAAAGAP